MARAWEGIEDLNDDGVNQTGISANVDTFNRNKDSLVIYPTAAATVVRNNPARTDRVKAIVTAGISILISNPYRIERKNLLYSRDDAQVAAPSRPDDGEFSAAYLIATASKINWFQTNHHTGQGAFTGYFKKCVSHLGLDNIDAHETACLWRFCHWVSTHVVLDRCGVTGPILDVDRQIPDVAPNWLIDRFGICREKLVFNVHTGHCADVWPEPSRDITMRAESFPSGAALVAITLRACDHIKGSFYARLVDRSAFAAMRELHEIANSITESAASYHVGARYLTGEASIRVPDPAVVLQSAAFAFLTNVARESTLASSPMVKKLTPDAAMSDNFRAVHLAIVKSASSVTEVISSFVAAHIGGDAFAAPEVYDAQVREISDTRRRKLRGGQAATEAIEEADTQA